MSSFSSAFVVVVAFIYLSHNVLAGPPPSAILYSERGGKGKTLKSRAENFPDLRQVAFDDLAQSACIRGTWIFYEAKNYSDPTGTIGYRYGRDSQSYCFNFEGLSGKISSFRYVGSSRDCTADSIDLYNGVHFTDEHLSTNQNIVDLNRTNVQQPQALIISGEAVWTLYEEPHFRGKHVCFSSNTMQKAPRFFADTEEIPLKYIASVQKGCLSHVQHV